MGADGAKVKGHYSFNYVCEDGQWKFLHHHSYISPEGTPITGLTINKERVRNLFHLWNDALATLDADDVAKQYFKDAAFLLIVSNTPLTDCAHIKDCFDNFLQKKPQDVD